MLGIIRRGVDAEQSTLPSHSFPSSVQFWVSKFNENAIHMEKSEQRKGMPDLKNEHHVGYQSADRKTDDLPAV